MYQPLNPWVCTLKYKYSYTLLAYFNSEFPFYTIVIKIETFEIIYFK